MGWKNKQVPLRERESCLFHCPSVHPSDIKQARDTLAHNILTPHTHTEGHDGSDFFKKMNEGSCSVAWCGCVWGVPSLKYL